MSFNAHLKPKRFKLFIFLTYSRHELRWKIYPQSRIAQLYENKDVEQVEVESVNGWPERPAVI